PRHARQPIDADVRPTPLSYYHRSGPVGQVFRRFNVDPSRPYAVIGLGTGTMASYSQPGQRVDFYDIDPVVVDISYDTNEFFHFVSDAEARGVNIGLILGDARLTFDPRDWRERKKISDAPASQEPPPLDSKVTQKRLLPLHKRPWHGGKAEQWFARLDRNRDGKIKIWEWPFSEKEFDACDTNKDGVISLAEARAF